MFAENDLLIINSEKIESQEKIWDNYRVIYEKISNENLKHKNQNLDKSSPLIKNVFSNSKETIKNPINEPSEIIKSRQQNQTFSTKTPAQSEISIDNKAEQYKYIFLAVLIVCLIILRVLFKNWF